MEAERRTFTYPAKIVNQTIHYRICVSVAILVPSLQLFPLVSVPSSCIANGIGKSSIYSNLPLLFLSLHSFSHARFLVFNRLQFTRQQFEGPLFQKCRGMVSAGVIGGYPRCGTCSVP